MSDYEVDFVTFHSALINTLCRLYTGFDTLYTCNRKAHKELKVQIYNRDYILAERSTSKNLFDFSYLTKRALLSFSYKGKFYNAITKHVVLFYNAPLTLNGDNNPTGKDRELKAVVLDQN